MRKLALPEEVLLQIEQPARYIGNEFNSVVKDKEKVALRGAFLFPDVYEIGMSHLGIQILYDMFNKREDMWCERVYSPWPDLDRVMREQSIPLFGLESQEPVKNEDFLFITLQYEMCYTNVLQALDLAGIPLHAVERTDEDPIVIGGGPCTYNPEPIAPFFDLFYIGEGEVVYDKLFDTYLENKKNGGTRQDFLKKACRIPGIYVPQFYEVTYHEDGTIAAFTPSIPEAPEKIKKQLVMDMTEATYPEKPVVPFIKATQDRVVLEIQRGCIRGCRFCQAGMVYRPTRERDVEKLKELATHMLRNTGHDEISLSSLSSSDYSHLPELVNYLIDSCPEKGVNISLPSLRIDAFSLDVMSKVQDIKKSSLTFAPEAGSQRMRNVINKGLTEEVILDGAGKAFEGGWNKVKLDLATGEELPGASLELKTSDGRLVDSWISGKTPHLVEGKLTAGENYILTEISAPDGYELAESISFTVPENGNFVKIEMTDRRKPPEEPETPTEPEQPTEPDIPTLPETPTEPEIPETPETPTEPERPTPSVPGEKPKKPVEAEWTESETESEPERKKTYGTITVRYEREFSGSGKGRVHQKDRTDLRTPETGDTGRPELAVTGLFVGFLGLWYLHIKKEREE